MTKQRKQIYSFTADAELVESAIATATAIDKNFSQFVCDALAEKIEREFKNYIDSIEIIKK